jgi:hypothetical protein
LVSKTGLGGLGTSPRGAALCSASRSLTRRSASQKSKQQLDDRADNQNHQGEASTFQFSGHTPANLANPANPANPANLGRFSWLDSQDSIGATFTNFTKVRIGVNFQLPSRRHRMPRRMVEVVFLFSGVVLFLTEIVDAFLDHEEEAMRTQLFLVGVILASTVHGQNLVFVDDFDSGDLSAWWAPARVGKSGQVTCYNEAGGVIACAGTGQNGELQSGAAWPVPRFVSTGDGTVTDSLTGLVWLRNANCFGTQTWVNALNGANMLANGSCGLTDGSMAGDWRLPHIHELHSLIDFEYYNPALSNAAGTGHWNAGDAFTGVQPGNYWSSTSYANSPQDAWYVGLNYGWAYYNPKTAPQYVWPVRGGEMCLSALIAVPTFLSFGTVEVGDFDTDIVTVTNICAIDIEMVAATDQQYFFVNPTIVTLDPAESVVLTVRFAPADGAVVPPNTSALITGNLNVAINSFSGLLTQVPLTGTAHAEPEIVTNPYGQGDLWTFPTTAAGNCSPIDLTSELTISNSGTAPLSLTSVATTGPFTIASAPQMTIDPGDSTVTILRFCPVVDNNALQTGHLIIASNDTNEPTITIDLEGQELP